MSLGNEVFSNGVYSVRTYLNPQGKWPNGSYAVLNTETNVIEHECSFLHEAIRASKIFPGEVEAAKNFQHTTAWGSSPDPTPTMTN